MKESRQPQGISLPTPNFLLAKDKKTLTRIFFSVIRNVLNDASFVIRVAYLTDILVA